MEVFSRDYWLRFASVYEDVVAFPRMADVASELGLAERTVRSHAAILRGQAAVDKSLPQISTRRGRADAPVAAGEIHRTIATEIAPEEEPLHELLERLFEAQDRKHDHLVSKDIIDINLKVAGPYGVVGLPDHHLNNIGTQTRRAFQDARLVAQHPALFCVGIGDWIDNFIVGFLERERRKDVISHSDSWRVMEHYVEILAPKLIAAISGNHNDWTASAGGVDVTKKMFQDRGLGAIYDTDQVRVRLNSPNGKSFTHIARHKYRGNSRFNSVHAITVHILERWEGEDVVWGGHIHVAGHVSMEKRWEGGSRVVHGIQLGSYKQHDNYAKREHFRPNQPFLTPVTIHDPRDGSTVFFEDLHKGVAYLDMLRSEEVPAAKRAA